MAKLKKTDVVFEYVNKYPNAANTVLSRIICKEVPEIFDNPINVRKLIQYCKGTLSKKQKKTRRTVNVVKSKSKGFNAIPEGLKEISDWDIVNLRLKKTLCLADIHIPYHDEKSLVLALEYGKDQGCVDILFNGDIIDMFAVSSYENDPRKRNFQGELDTYYQIIEIIKKHFDGRIIYKIGNHEERYNRYMQLKAPEILGVDLFELSNILRFKDFGIEDISNKKPIKVNNHLTVVHGHEFSRSVFNPVNPARGLFLRSNATSLCAHHHQTSEHSQQDINGKLITCWSLGCLSNLHPKWLPINKWNHGFAIIDTKSDDVFVVDNKKIIENHVV